MSLCVCDSVYVTCSVLPLCMCVCVCVHVWCVRVCFQNRWNKVLAGMSEQLLIFSSWYMLIVTSKIQDITHYLYHGDLEISHAYQHWFQQVQLNTCHNHEKTWKDIQFDIGCRWPSNKVRAGRPKRYHQSQQLERLHSDSGLENQHEG